MKNNFCTKTRQYDVFYLTPLLKTSDPYLDGYFDFAFYRLVHNNQLEIEVERSFLNDIVNDQSTLH